MIEPIRAATAADAARQARGDGLRRRGADRDGPGFVAAWTTGDPGFGAYIDNLHVHPERRDAGLGRRLLGRAMRRVADRGETRAYLRVFDASTRAINFYRRLGGKIVEQGFDEIDGLKVPQSRIVRHDTLRLAEACGLIRRR